MRFTGRWSRNQGGKGILYHPRSSCGRETGTRGRDCLCPTSVGKQALGNGDGENGDNSWTFFGSASGLQPDVDLFEGRVPEFLPEAGYEVLLPLSVQ